MQPDNINQIKKFQKRSPTIVIDGVFFQFNQTGIARVWCSLLEEWAKSDFGQHLLVLDRDNTAPKVPGINYKVIEPYDYRYSSIDCTKLQEICDDIRADVFISTYYTTPLSTPTVFMAYDMVPEVMKFDLNELCWQEKHRGILYSHRYITISQNTAKDLLTFFPYIDPKSVTVAYCGVDALFKPTVTGEVEQFKIKYNINKPYFLLVGSRLSLKGYKNAILFFKALSQLENSQEIAVVCVGGEPNLEPELQAFSNNIEVHLLRLNDAELRLAYGGAIALVYPSRYEGFGLPIAEAMACGCPVITCHNSSIPEVAGNAALYVGEDNIQETIEALQNIQKAEIRHQLINLGLEQVKQFSWKTMADTVAQVLQETALENRNKPMNQATLIWQAFRQEQVYRQQDNPLTDEVNRLTQENQDLLLKIHKLEQKIEELSTARSAIRQLAKKFVKKTGLKKFFKNTSDD